MLTWKKNVGDVWTSAAGPFAVTISPKGDGRWGWSVVSDGKPNPEAVGIGASLGAAKTACEQLVKRSGRV